MEMRPENLTGLCIRSGKVHVRREILDTEADIGLHCKKTVHGFPARFHSEFLQFVMKQK